MPCQQKWLSRVSINILGGPKYTHQNRDERDLTKRLGKACTGTSIAITMLTPAAIELALFGENVF